MKVDIDKVDDEYKTLVKEDMSKSDIAFLGTVIIKHKFSKVKHKILGVFHAKKTKEKD